MKRMLFKLNSSFWVLTAGLMALACQPQFNKKETTKSSGGRSTASSTSSSFIMNADPHAAGGLYQTGTSTNYKLQKVTVGTMVRSKGTSANYTVKGGAAN